MAGFLMRMLLLILLLGDAGHRNDHVVTDKVDLIELNHFYDDNGALVFDQVIFWDWHPFVPGREGGEFVVRAWRLSKLERPMATVRDWRRGGYTLIFLDGGVIRKIRAPSFRETWTQYDPEMQNRKMWPEDKRRGLQKRPK
jgi:hypothetical protein